MRFPWQKKRKRGWIIVRPHVFGCLEIGHTFVRDSKEEVERVLKGFEAAAKIKELEASATGYSIQEIELL